MINANNKWILLLGMCFALRRRLGSTMFKNNAAIRFQLIAFFFTINSTRARRGVVNEKVTPARHCKQYHVCVGHARAVRVFCGWRFTVATCPHFRVFSGHIPWKPNTNTLSDTRACCVVTMASRRLFSHGSEKTLRHWSSPSTSNRSCAYFNNTVLLIVFALGRAYSSEPAQSVVGAKRVLPS